MPGATPWEGASGAEEDFAVYGSAFRALMVFSASLSIVGSLAVIGAFALFPQLRRYFARCVVYLAISDLWLCASMVLGEARSPHYTKCMVQATFSSFFGLSSILWTVVIADSLRRVLLQRDLSVESKHEVRIHMAAWGLPTLAILLGVVTGVFGPAGYLCWIRNTASGTLVRLVTFYLPLWFAIGYCLWVYWHVNTMLQQLLERQQLEGNVDSESNLFEHQRDIERQRQSLQWLLFLPLILVFCWTPGSIRRLIDVFLPNITWMPLDYLSMFTGPLQGALNAVVYGSTPAVRDALTGRLDHSARMLRSVQARLRAARPSESSRRRWSHLEEEDGSSSPDASSASILSVGEAPRSPFGGFGRGDLSGKVSSAPLATTVGRPSEEVAFGRGERSSLSSSFSGRDFRSFEDEDNTAWEGTPVSALATSSVPVAAVELRGPRAAASSSPDCVRQIPDVAAMPKNNVPGLERSTLGGHESTPVHFSIGDDGFSEGEGIQKDENVEGEGVGEVEDIQGGAALGGSMRAAPAAGGGAAASSSAPAAVDPESNN